MKRSEMIELMIKDWLGLFPNEVAQFDMKDIIEELRLKMGYMLNHLQRNGMLPPRRFIENKGEEPQDPAYHGLNGWEPE